MADVRKVLVLVARGGLSQKTIATACSCSKRLVSRCAALVKEREWTEEVIKSFPQAEIDNLFPRKQREPRHDVLAPKFEEYIERKQRQPKIPLLVFYSEYQQQAQEQDMNAMSYQSFTRHFRSVSVRLDVSARLTHQPAEKVFVDWAGDPAYLVDPDTLERYRAQVFVACFPYSDYIFAKAYYSQKTVDWIAALNDMLFFFGGVPQLIVVDNCSTAVDQKQRQREVVLQRDFKALVDHYGCGALPTRVRAPKDKALVEAAVDLVERWIISLANEKLFTSLDKLNDFIAERITWLNNRPFTKKDGTRTELFCQAELPLLLPLPDQRYRIAQWKKCKVRSDYHIVYKYNYYSVPFALVGKLVDVRICDDDLDIFYDNSIVATHKLMRWCRGKASTVTEHMPERHQNFQEPWKEQSYRHDAALIGPACEEVIERTLSSHRLASRSFIDCKNILSLAKKFSPELLEIACVCALEDHASIRFAAIKKQVSCLNDRTHSDNKKAATPTPIGLLNDSACYELMGGDDAIC